MDDKISVIMSNYNCSDFIKDAIDSIMTQSYGNWELIIVDDYSSDDSVDIIKKYNDDRIRLICNDENIGLAASLNKAIKEANGKYIARLDPDDFSYPNRLEKQLIYLKDNDNISICGSNVELFGETKKSVTHFPLESNKLMAYIPFCSPIPHSTWMINVARFESGFEYSSEYRSSQDYELMSRIWKEKKEIACLPESLVKYRVRNDSITGQNIDKVDPNRVRVQKSVLEEMGIEVGLKEIEEISMLSNLPKGRVKGLYNYAKICNKILLSNRGDIYFSQRQCLNIICKTELANAAKILGINI